MNSSTTLLECWLVFHGSKDIPSDLAHSFFDERMEQGIPRWERPLGPGPYDRRYDRPYRLPYGPPYEPPYDPVDDAIIDLPPRRPNAVAKKWQFVWPRDKRQKSARWGNRSRWMDILTNKGPDIWIATQGTDEPHRPVWSGWESPPWQRDGRWDNLGYPYRQDDRMPPIFGSRSRDGKKYDFKTRKWRTERPGVWSDVKWSYCKPYKALYYRDVDQVEWVNPTVDTRPAHAHHDPNPFAYDPQSALWRWHTEPDRPPWRRWDWNRRLV